MKLSVHQIFPNDFIFDSFIGLAGVEYESKHLRFSCDTANSAYELELEHAFKMHGKLPYTTPNNHYYQVD
jgi:hypothetical protein